MSPVSCLVDVAASERRKKRVRFRDELIPADSPDVVQLGSTTTGGLSGSPHPAALPSGSSDSASPTSYASETEPWVIHSPLTDTWKLPHQPASRVDRDSDLDANVGFSSPGAATCHLYCGAMVSVCHGLSVPWSQCAITQLAGWWNHKVSMVGASAPLTVLPSVPCQDAVDIMLQESFDQVPIVDQSGELLGMVTLRSLMTSLVVQRALPSTPVGEVMCRQLCTLSRDDSLLQLSKILQHHRCALIVHSQRRLTAKGQVATKVVVIGIVTPTDLLAYIMRSSLSV